MTNVLNSRAREHPQLQISPGSHTPPSAFGSPISHGHPESSTQIDGNSQGSKSPTESNDAHPWTWNKRTGRNQCTSFLSDPCNNKLTGCNHIGWVTIDILPDDVLLDIFDFLVVEEENRWCTLVHVCRRWRNVIFGSPHRLNLRLICSDETPVRETLDVWPPLPIVILHSSRSKSGWDNVIAALGRNDRVCKIKMEVDPQWEKALEVMQEPFPALTDLTLHSDIEIASVFPDSFMGGSAPRLQYLMLNRVSIPGLPKLLSSATDLVLLKLRHISYFGYISPEAIVTCLSSSPRLERLYLGFDSPLSRPNGESRRLPPHALFSPLSSSCTLKGSASIWRTSWPGSILLYSPIWR